MASFKVGNRRRIRFWEDVWWGEEAFSSRFADLIDYHWLQTLLLLSCSFINMVLCLMGGIFASTGTCVLLNFKILVLYQ